MTGHNARRPRTGRERRPWWPPSEASYLTVWTLNDRFFASRVHCILRRVLSEYWRKETEKSKVFCGVVGLDGRCSAQAEQRKKPVAVVHLPGAYLSTETNLVPIRGVMREEFVTGQTHTQRHGIKAVWTARAPALARTWPPARTESSVLEAKRVQGDLWVATCVAFCFLKTEEEASSTIVWSRDQNNETAQNFKRTSAILSCHGNL